MDCSTPGFPVLHHLLELAQTHVHWISDAIQSFSFSVALFSCLQSFPASGSFLISKLFASDGQSFRASVSASVLLMSIQDWFPLGLTGFLCMMMQEKHVLSISEDTLLLQTTTCHFLSKYWLMMRMGMWYCWPINKCTIITYNGQNSMISMRGIWRNIMSIICHQVAHNSFERGCLCT